MRVLGLDYGSKRVGVALGDTETRLASPWRVLTVDDRLDLLRRIHELVEIEKIQKIIVGVPRSLRNRSETNQQAQDIHGFIDDLIAQGLDVEEEDETMTSGLAAAQMRERGEKGKRDDLAAANILQSWLDKKNVLSP